MSEKRFSRKGFLGHLFGSVASIAGELFEDSLNRIEEAFPPMLLPPGAGTSLERFMAACKRCGDCVRACPHFVLKRNPKRGGFHEGLPCMAMRENFCRMCSDWPCISACPTGALQKPQKDQFLRVGTARVYPRLCLRSAGQDCRSCQERCMGTSLEGGAARSALTIVNNLPAIDPGVCTGCGGCEFHCPVQPGAAVVVED